MKINGRTKNEGGKEKGKPEKVSRLCSYFHHTFRQCNTFIKEVDQKESVYIPTTLKGTVVKRYFPKTI